MIMPWLGLLIDTALLENALSWPRQGTPRMYV
jgi:hypothetical protein